MWTSHLLFACCLGTLLTPKLVNVKKHLDATDSTAKAIAKGNAVSINISMRIQNNSDGRVIRASASGAVNLGLIPSPVKSMTIKLVFTASLLDAQL